MLSETTIQIIKSTVPVLEKHGTDITKRFYKMMFEGHPELLNVFNHANQRQGRQQSALANAVLAAAKFIDNLEAIAPAVMLIAHKHRSLGIQPEQYPIVGHYLLAAIKDVFGDAATEEILGAWKEAYGVIADAFIGVERKLYDEVERQDGGWSGFRAFRVTKKVKESDAPNRPYYRISVKREDMPGKPARKVSVYLHDHIEEGGRLWLSAPAGEFTLDRGKNAPSF